MIFSGDNSISVPEIDSLSFNIPISIDSISGTGSFGFAGTGSDGNERLMQFIFESGKIKDFNGNYVDSYFPDKVVNFSGDIFSGSHVYYIDSHPTSFSGIQDYFKFKRFFYNSDGFNITSKADLYIQQPSLTLSTLTQVDPPVYDTAPIQHFDISGSYTGVINKSVESRIFSSSIEGGDAGLFTILKTDLNAGNKTGSFVLTRNSDFTLYNTKSYTMDLNFNTDFGIDSKTLFFTGANFSEGIKKESYVSQVTNEIDIAHQMDHPFILKRNNYSLFYSLSNSGVEQKKPLGIELSYYRGDTGTFKGFTGDINIVDGGEAYISGRTFVTAVDNDGDGFIADIITDSGINGDGTTGAIIGFNVINIGENYTGAVPTIIISGEGGVDGDLVAQQFSYTKHFFETWDLSTGYYDEDDTFSFSGAGYSGTDNVSVTEFRDENYGEGVLLTNTRKRFAMNVDWFSYWDTGIVVAKLRVTGDNFDISNYITGRK